VQIVLVGKYTSLQDSYISVVKALQHAALACNRKLTLEWVEASELEPEMKEQSPLKYHNAWKTLCAASGILVPGGFGERGTEGKIIAAQWAREHSIPYLGICLGLQVAVIEFARNVCKLKGLRFDFYIDNLIMRRCALGGVCTGYGAQGGGVHARDIQDSNGWDDATWLSADSVCRQARPEECYA
jgi:hypothetical protein